MLIWLFPLLTIGLLLQSAVLSRLLPAGIAPDLIMVLVVLWGAVRGWTNGLAAGMIGGLLVSLVSVAPAGVHLLQLGTVGAAAGLAEARIPRAGLLVFPLFAAAGTLVVFSLGALGLQAAGWIVPWHSRSLLELLSRTALNAAVSLPLAPLMQALAGPRAAPPREVGA